MKLNKKQKKNLQIIGGIALIIVVAFFLNNTFSLFGSREQITGTNVNNPSWTIFWDKIGSNINIQASVSAKTSSSPPGNYCIWHYDDNDPGSPPACERIWTYNDLCRTNDAGLSINNIVTKNDKIVLQSSFNTANKQCLDYNFIKANFIMKEGTLNCEISRSGISTIDIDGVRYYSCGSKGDICLNQNILTNNISSFSKDYKDGEEVKIEIRTFGDEKGLNSLGRIECSYIKILEKDFYRFENNECKLIKIKEMGRTELDFDTIEECQEKVEKDFYRFENNNCNLIKLKEIDKTEIDFNTIEDCEINIVNKTKQLFLPILIVSLIVGILVFFLFRRKK